MLTTRAVVAVKRLGLFGRLISVGLMTPCVSSVVCPVRCRVAVNGFQVVEVEVLGVLGSVRNKRVTLL